MAESTGCVGDFKIISRVKFQGFTAIIMSEIIILLRTSWKFFCFNFKLKFNFERKSLNCKKKVIYKTLIYY